MIYLDSPSDMDSPQGMFPQIHTWTLLGNHLYYPPLRYKLSNSVLINDIIAMMQKLGKNG
jgi:hypothetical protein